MITFGLALLLTVLLLLSLGSAVFEISHELEGELDRLLRLFLCLGLFLLLSLGLSEPLCFEFLLLSFEGISLL